MRRYPVVVALLVLLLGAVVTAWLLLRQKPPTSITASGRVTILAGDGSPAVLDGPALAAAFADPFGIAVDDRGNVYVADGGASNRIRRITREDRVETVAGGGEGYADGQAGSAMFNTPSGIAIGPDGSLIVADTSNNRIRRVDRSGRVTTLAGTGETGLTDGPASEARFDAPVAVAVSGDGTVYVADTYNDCIRRVDQSGNVTTLAGGIAGFEDGRGESARLNTPSGIAVDSSGILFVADTANHAIRRLDPSGEVTTFAGGSRGRADGNGLEARFDHPVGIAVTHDGFLFVTELNGGRIRRITPQGEVTTYAGGRTGFTDGVGDRARFNAPSGIAVDRNGVLYVADTSNYLVRRIEPVESRESNAGEDELVLQPGSSVTRPSRIPRLPFDRLFPGESFPWPLLPQDRPREITGVAGEARGWSDGAPLHHLHTGVDVRGAMGESVVAVFDEKVSSPVAAWDFEGANEGVTVGLFSYIHVRVGRDASNSVIQDGRFKPTTDDTGSPAGVRVRRGASFRIGDFVGTVNRLFHVHLNVGPWNGQVNPLLLPFASRVDSVAPVVEPRGIELLDPEGRALVEKRDGRVVIRGDVQIVVECYDRADDSARHRKLGIYRLGYQIVGADGHPVPGFEEPLINIEFNLLPPDDESVFVAFADGSGVSAYGTPTRFRYLVTNVLRDGVARRGLLRTEAIPPGDYVLRVIAEDLAGNRATGPATELAIRVEGVGTLER